MKSRVSLDFTSLLDITMIILFFFLINFKFSTDKIKEDATAQIENANALFEQLEADRKLFEEEKSQWQKEADTEFERLRNADENAAANAEALWDFNNGIVLKIDLSMKNSTEWEMIIFNGDKQIGAVLSDTDSVKNGIISVMDENGFDRNDVIICIFMYNGHDPGSARIKERGGLIEKVKSVRDEYKSFYCADVKKEK